MRDTAVLNLPALPNITVAQLQYLIAAVDHATWAEAATALGTSQSAVSQGLAELQRRLGIELFERSGRRRVPLPHAAPVIDHARRVLAQTANLHEWAAAVEEAARIADVGMAASDSAPGRDAD